MNKDLVFYYCKGNRIRTDHLMCCMTFRYHAESIFQSVMNLNFRNTLYNLLKIKKKPLVRLMLCWMWPQRPSQCFPNMHTSYHTITCGWRVDCSVILSLITDNSHILTSYSKKNIYIVFVLVYFRVFSFHYKHTSRSRQWQRYHPFFCKINFTFWEKTYFVFHY